MCRFLLPKVTNGVEAEKRSDLRDKMVLKTLADLLRQQANLEAVQAMVSAVENALVTSLSTDFQNEMRQLAIMCKPSSADVSAEELQGARNYFESTPDLKLHKAIAFLPSGQALTESVDQAIATRSADRGVEMKLAEILKISKELKVPEVKDFKLGSLLVLTEQEKWQQMREGLATIKAVGSNIFKTRSSKELEEIEGQLDKAFTNLSDALFANFLHLGRPVFTKIVYIIDKFGTLTDKAKQAQCTYLQKIRDKAVSDGLPPLDKMGFDALVSDEHKAEAIGIGAVMVSVEWPSENVFRRLELQTGAPAK